MVRTGPWSRLMTGLPAIDPTNATLPSAAARTASTRLGGKINPSDDLTPTPLSEDQTRAAQPGIRSAASRRVWAAGQPPQQEPEPSAANMQTMANSASSQISMERPHVGSLRMSRRIVRSFGESVDEAPKGPWRLWIDSPVQACHQV